VREATRLRRVEGPLPGVPAEGGDASSARECAARCPDERGGRVRGCGWGSWRALTRRAWPTWRRRANPKTVARWRAKIVTVEGSSCAWWTGAVSGRGHGRFWLSSGRVVVAHRFAFAVVHGVEAAAAVPVLGHRCDNPLCQRVGPGHVVASSYVENRREWAIRRGAPVLRWVIRAGPRQRARELRDWRARTRRWSLPIWRGCARIFGEQLTLW
jgi:hypothetical protein